MLKGLISILIFGLIFIAIVFLVVLRFVYKGIKFAKEDRQKYEETGGKKFNRQEYIRYERQKREKNPFGDDYFKSSDDGKAAKQEATQKQSTTRRTTTSSGVTIIDGRDTEEKRKIFDHDDGEYVEFEEV